MSRRYRKIIYSDLELTDEANERWLKFGKRFGGCLLADRQPRGHYETRDRWGSGMDAPLLFTADKVGWDVSLLVMGYYGSQYSKYYIAPRLSALRWTFSLGRVQRERWVRRRRRRRVRIMLQNLKDREDEE